MLLTPSPVALLFFALYHVQHANCWSGGGAGWGGGYFPSDYGKVKIAHGVLGSLAWVVFLPLGAALLRLLKSHAVRWHGAVQLFGYALFIAASGTGIWMCKWTSQFSKAHSIVGLVILGTALTQVIGGLLQHSLFKKGYKTPFLGSGHVWIGRALITLGMINGGLGLLLSDRASRAQYIAYSVVAAIIWLFYITVVFCVRMGQCQATVQSKDLESESFRTRGISQHHHPQCTCARYQVQKQAVIGLDEKTNLDSDDEYYQLHQARAVRVHERPTVRLDNTNKDYRRTYVIGGQRKRLEALNK